MSDPLSSGDPHEQKRRSTRIAQAVPITVTGVDALGQPFKERTTTVTVNCHGCKYQSKHYVPKTSVVSLEIPRPETGLPPRLTTGRVIWVQRPRTVRELFQIGLEFEVAGNVWGIAFPPEDWFSHPDEQGATSSHAAQPAKAPEPSARVDVAPSVTAAPATAAPIAAAPAPPKKIETQAAPPVQPPVASAPPVATAPAVPERKIHLVPAAEPPQEAQLTVLREHIGKLLADAKETIGKTARNDAQAAINDEMTVVRQQLDAQLHEAVERAIKVSLERVSESASKKLMQQATERTNVIVEEARKATEVGAGQLDLRIRQAVEQVVDQVVGQAVGHAVGQAVGLAFDEKVGPAVEQASERAAQQAADKATAQNLQQSVQETVERFIAEREATAPSLKILSSPEAAQQHLDSWKRDLEETAQAVRGNILEQTHADANAASARLHIELETAVSGASQQIGATLDEVSQARIAQAEADIAARAAVLRSSLDQTINGSQAAVQSLSAALEQGQMRADEAKSHLAEAAQAAVQSLNATLEQGRTQADETKTQLTEAAQSTVDRARASLDQLLSSKTDEIARRTDELSQAKIAQVEADVAARAADLRSSLDQAIAGSQGTIQSLTSSLEQERARAEDARSQLAEAAQSAVDRARAELDQSLSSKTDEIARKMDEIAQGKIAQAEAAVAARAESLRSSLDQTIAGSQAAIQSLSAALQQERQRADETKSQLAEAAQAAVDRARMGLDQLLSSQSNEIARKADDIISERTKLVAPAVDNFTQRAIAQFSEELDHALASRVSEAGSIASELSQAAQQAAAAHEHAQAQMQQLFDRAAQAQSGLNDQICTAAEVQAGLRDWIHTASEDAVQESLSRIREEASRLPAQVEQAGRDAASKFEAEIDKRATELQHESFESLSKAADWYQKKAQTTMQSSLEKVVDQSAAHLRDRAAEISSLVSTELDHHRRTYAEHGRAEMEEAATEIATRGRDRLTESAAMVNAGFSDEVRRIAAESLKRFQEVSLEALEKSRSDLEFNREGAQAEFRKDLEQQMVKGVQKAQNYLESQLAPLVETWEARRNEQQRQWMELLKKSSGESIEQYKARLENASNSWLLASATTLGQSSQAVLDTLARSAEKRLRETCTEVLAGIGDTIKERLMGISSDFSAGHEDDATPSSTK